MTEAQTAFVFSGAIFMVFVYVMNWKRVHKKWPSWRNPFYNKKD